MGGIFCSTGYSEDLSLVLLKWELKPSLVAFIKPKHECRLKSKELVESA